jgi:hypothetical protein
MPESAKTYTLCEILLAAYPRRRGIFRDQEQEQKAQCVDCGVRRTGV